MAGSAIQQAGRGLMQALNLLQPGDMFAICAFNDKEEWFREDTLHVASYANVQEAVVWVSNVQACGLTDILSPYKRASSLLSRTYSSSTTDNGKIYPNEMLESLPFIFLLTDGAVNNEVNFTAATY